jgi:MoxR-like ATPase
MEDQTAVVEALGVAVAARVPVLLWGAPGTGKTSVIRAMAAAAVISLDKLFELMCV